MKANDYEMIAESRYSGKISKVYGKVAWIYDHISNFELPHHREAVKRAGIQKKDKVLEVACGTGRGLMEMAPYIGEEGKIYGIDLTQAMLARAIKKVKKNNLQDKVDLRIGDARNLPFPDNMFDIVYNSYMFDLIDSKDIPKIVSEFKRVLRTGGQVVLVNMSKNIKEKTLYEKLYERGILWQFTGSCRPVFLQHYLQEADFKEITREYRENDSLFFAKMLIGTEIVLAVK